MAPAPTVDEALLVELAWPAFADEVEDYVDGEFEIAVTMFLEHAEHGYTASGYVAEAINFYLSRKYGKDFQMYGTPRLRFAIVTWRNASYIFVRELR